MAALDVATAIADDRGVEPSPIVSLLDALSRLQPGRSRSDLRRLLEAGRVTINGNVVKIARMPVAPDDAVAVNAVAKPRPASLPFSIVHIDDDLMVIDKPAGLLTSSVPREKRPTALAIARAWAVAERPRAKVGLVHRLDADASGLLCFSLHNAAHAALKLQFADHSATRTYAAVVAGKVTPAVGTIKNLLAEHIDGTVHATRDGRHGKSAVTHYETTAAGDPDTLLRVTLETGRKHQIRSHLAERGWPIVGDRLYGGMPAERLMLAAVLLELVHPATGEPVTYEIDTPAALKRLVKR